MDFEYIHENLDKIIENPDSIMYIKPYNIGTKKALFAVMKEDEGVYRKIQLTKPQGKLHFPIKPIYLFSRGPGYFYLKNFTILDNYIAFNMDYLEGFKCKFLENNKYFNLGIFAIFNDGTATFIYEDNDRKFQHKGGFGRIAKLLKPPVPFNEKDNMYEIIESYKNGDNDTFIIPSLQKTNGKVKSLIRTNSKQV